MLKPDSAFEELLFSFLTPSSCGRSVCLGEVESTFTSTPFLRNILHEMNIYFPSRIHSHFSDLRLSLSSTFTHKLLIFLVYISHQADKKESDALAFIETCFSGSFRGACCGGLIAAYLTLIQKAGLVEVLMVSQAALGRRRQAHICTRPLC